MMLKCRLKNMHGRKLLDNPVDADNGGVGYDVEVQVEEHARKEVVGQSC